MSDNQPKNPRPNNKGPIIVIVIVTSIIAVASVLAILLFNSLAAKEPRTLHYDNTNPPSQRSRPTDTDRTPDPVRDAGKTPTRDDSQPSPDTEEFWENARQAARDINDGEDPIPCENPCDCPQGMDCQLGSQLCIPGPFPVYCCDNEGCPEGEQCRTEEGGYGVCDGQD